MFKSAKDPQCLHISGSHPWSSLCILSWDSRKYVNRKNRPIRQLQVEMKEILKIYLHLLHWIKQAAKLQQSLNRNRYLIARYELKMYNICSQSNQPTQFQINTGYAWRQQWTNVINAFHINAKQTTDVCQPIGSSVSDTHTSVSPSYHIACSLIVWPHHAALHNFIF